jgi:hypothetical protein
MLGQKQPLHDVDTQSDKSEDESEDVDTPCCSCNKELHPPPPFEYIPCMLMDRFLSQLYKVSLYDL